MQIKRSLHGDGMRVAGADVVQHASPSVVRAHTETWEQANRQYYKHVSATESFTGGVPKKMVGGKAYWFVCPSLISHRTHGVCIVTRA